MRYWIKRSDCKSGTLVDGLIIISVKGGENIGVKDVRDLRGVIEREDAEMGILITLADPPGTMMTEAAAAGLDAVGLGAVAAFTRACLNRVQEFAGRARQPVEARHRQHGAFSRLPRTLRNCARSARAPFAVS